MDPVITARGVTKHFGPVLALDTLDLEVPGGQVVGFLGPNGAGKSTTIRILLDLARADAGEVRVLGVDPRSGPQVRARIGYVAGELRLDDRLTVGETLRSWARLRGGLDLGAAHELCERLDLDPGRKAKGLSSGNRRKVGLVGAFMARPDLLILDEPTAGLDPLVQAEFQILLAEAVAAGASVFLSSHVFALVNLAFWPSFESSNSLAELEDSMGSLLEAFGAQGLSTPAGYLDGQLFAFLLPLLFSGAAVAMTSALTSGDEDAGRLELLHALPLSRTTLWLARLASATLVLGAIVVATAVLVAACLAPFSLDEAGYGRVVFATLACGALALFHGSVAYALGGLGSSRGVALGGAIAVLVVGYVVGFVLPIAEALAGARAFSPWNWALGEQPVTDGVRPGRLVLLLAVTAILIVVGTWGVNRRDIRTA